MALYRIWGFLLQPESMSATWGSQSVTETCLVEMTTPLDNIIDVQAALPAYDFGVTPEPTFTIGLSHHPDQADLIFKQAANVREHPDSGRPFWLVDMVYETAQWLNDIFPGENVGAGNIGYQRRLRDNTGTSSPTAREVIINPWDEPPTWSSSTRRVKMTRYKDATGNTLRHANYLPLTEGIDIDIDLEVHTFTWNVQYSTFNFETAVAPYIGKINLTAMPRLKDAPIQHVLLETCTCTENYRTVNIGMPNGQVGNGIQTFHFITLTATFVVDRRQGFTTSMEGVPVEDRPVVDSPEGYFREANRRVSMHTLQLGNAGTVMLPIWGYVPIPVNDRGDVATSPWPLASADYVTLLGSNMGVAVPYDAMNTLNPETSFAVIDPLLPLATTLTEFTVTHDLEIP